MPRPMPPRHTSYHISDPACQCLIPPFVLALVQDILEEREDDDGEADKCVLYAELSGCIDPHFSDMSRHILLWIASHDETLNFIYIGGSVCWIEPDSHYLHFHAIREELLPPHAERDPLTWWIVHKPEYGEPPHPCVYHIHIVPEDQVPDGFPDL
jgi:hypothetical protein